MTLNRAFFQLKIKATQEPESAYELGIHYASIDDHSPWDLIMAASLFWWAKQQDNKYEKRLSDWLSSKGQLKATIERLLDAPFEWNKLFQVATLIEPSEAGEIQKRQALQKFDELEAYAQRDGYVSSPSQNFQPFSPSSYVGSLVGMPAFSLSSDSKGYRKLPTAEEEPARPTSPTKGVAKSPSVPLPPPPPPKSYNEKLKFFTDKIIELEFELHKGWGKAIRGKDKNVSTSAAKIFNLIDNQSFNESSYKEALEKIQKILEPKRNYEDCYDETRCCNFFRKRDKNTTKLYRELYQQARDLSKKSVR